MSQTALRTMTVDEFFVWQESQDRNYELVDGVPVMTIKAKTGVTDQHDRVTVNLIASLGMKPRGSSCRPKTSNTSVLTMRGTRRPDVTVECGAPERRAMAADEPRVVVEVLSPSTTRYDRFQKLAEYQQHAAIQVILIVDSEAPRVTIWRRTEANWQPEEHEGLDAVLPLPEIGTDLPLSDIYADMTFEATGTLTR